MNRTITFVVGTVALLGSAALVVVADQQGWLKPKPAGESAAGTVGETPTVTSPFAVRPRAESSGAEVMPAANVRELAALPRAQRPPSVDCANAEKAVVFDDGAVAQLAGIRWQSVAAAPVTHMIACNVEIAFDGDHMAHVSCRAPGVVKQALKQAGDRAVAGETLAVVESSELGGAKASLLQAGALVRLWSDNLARFKSMSGNGAVTQTELIEAETKLAEARIALSSATQRLRALGLSITDIDAIAASEDTSSMLPVVAPFDGVVIERHAALGEVVDTQTPLFMLADNSRMWAMLDVRESDLRNVRLGQQVIVTLPALAGESFRGSIDWISASVDETTRTLKARATLDNAGDDSPLRANMFGRAQINASDSQPRLVVPRDAVQWDGCCNLVFVRQTDAVFQPFKVKLGADLGGHYVVLDGLREGDEVVTDGAFLLRTQLLKSSIGAGCCEAGGVKKE